VATSVGACTRKEQLTKNMSNGLSKCMQKQTL
jgi:hypothetical protein